MGEVEATESPGKVRATVVSLPEMLPATCLAVKARVKAQRIAGPQRITMPGHGMHNVRRLALWSLSSRLGTLVGTADARRGGSGAH
jgi:hypothetical protein